MFSVTLNKEKNRIYIELGQIKTGEGKLLIDTIKEKVSKLRKGFSGVSDIRSFTIIDPDEAQWAEVAIDILVNAGMDRAVRVTNSLSTLKEIKEKRGYTIRLASSIEEADKILDEYEAS